MPSLPCPVNPSRPAPPPAGTEVGRLQGNRGVQMALGTTCLTLDESEDFIQEDVGSKY